MSNKIPWFLLTEEYTPELEAEGLVLCEYFDKAVAEHELCNCNYCKENEDKRTN